MKSSVFVSLVVLMAITPVFAQLPRCNVGADPVNKDRTLTTDEEVTINPADKPIKYGSRSGHDVSCILQAGVPIVINKTTGTAVWVFGCGNPIKTFWVPKRIPAVGLQKGDPGPRGDKGDPGPQGLKGDPGEPGQEYSSSQSSEPWAPGYDANQKLAKGHDSGGHHGLLIGGLIGAGATIGSIVAVVVLSHGNKTTPVCAAGDPTCTINTGGANSVGSIGIKF